MQRHDEIGQPRGAAVVLKHVAANGSTVIGIDSYGKMHGAGDNTYKQYVGKIIYVKNSVELSFANTTYSNEIKRFYIRKKYVRKNRK